MPYGYLVAVFDVLGFKQRLAQYGLEEMTERYKALIDVVNYRKEQVRRVFGEYGMEESPYWSREGDVFLFTQTHGAYASDSIMVWANRTWPEARGFDVEECKRRTAAEADGWKYHPIPCDNFLDVCNDVICRGLEVDLPLRGGIAVGRAVLDQERNIYLGQPIIEAARLEKAQDFIGTGFCASAIDQLIPQRYLLHFNQHIKEKCRPLWGGVTLDWPRHWRRTREGEVKRAVSLLNTDPQYARYYKNTYDVVAVSERYAAQYEDKQETSIRSVYEQFSWSKTTLAVNARAVRRVPVDDGA
jgi:hypothetical protein